MESLVNEGQDRLRREREQVEAHQQALSHRMYSRFGIQATTSQTLLAGDVAVRSASAPAGDWPAPPSSAASGGASPSSAAALSQALLQVPPSQQLQQTPRLMSQQTPRQQAVRSQGAQWSMQERQGLPGPVSPITRREKAEQRWEILFGSSCPLKPRASKGVPNIGTSAHWQGLMLGAAWEPVKRTPRIEPVSAIMYGPEAAMRRDIIHSNTKSARLKASDSMTEEELTEEIVGVGGGD